MVNMVRGVMLGPAYFIFYLLLCIYLFVIYLFIIFLSFFFFFFFLFLNRLVENVTIYHYTIREEQFLHTKCLCAPKHMGTHLHTAVFHKFSMYIMQAVSLVWFLDIHANFTKKIICTTRSFGKLSIYITQ